MRVLIIFLRQTLKLLLRWHSARLNFLALFLISPYNFFLILRIKTYINIQTILITTVGIVATGSLSKADTNITDSVLLKVKQLLFYLFLS